MKHIDTDIIAALKHLASDGDAQRVLTIKAKHQKQDQERFETQMQLLIDEVERAVPRNHLLFELVLILTVARKVERIQQEIELRQQESEFPSALNFPNGW
jgi:hypothetical protein